MELRNYLQIIGKRIWLFISIVAIVVLGTYIFSVAQPVSYDGSSSLNVVVKKPAEASVNYYDYDNYYAIQGSSLFADTVVAWLGDPTNVFEIYDIAGLPKPELSVKSLAKLITTRKKPPASISVNLNDTDKDKVEKLMSAINKFVSQKTENWSKEGLTENLHVDYSAPVVIEHKPSVLVNTLIGLVAGIILGLAMVFFVDYMKRDK